MHIQGMGALKDAGAHAYSKKHRKASQTTSPAEQLPKETGSEAFKGNLTPPVSLQL